MPNLSLSSDSWETCSLKGSHADANGGNSEVCVFCFVGISFLPFSFSFLFFLPLFYNDCLSFASQNNSYTKIIETERISVQFSSVAQLCPTLCDPMNRSTLGLPVHHQIPEFTQTHVHRVGRNKQFNGVSILLNPQNFLNMIPAVGYLPALSLDSRFQGPQLDLVQCHSSQSQHHTKWYIIVVICHYGFVNSTT